MSTKNLKIAGALVASLFAGQAAAGVITAGTVSGTPGNNVTVPISFTGDGSTVDFQGDVTFSTTGLTFVSATAVAVGGQPVGTCARRAAPNDNQIRVGPPAGLAAAAASGVYCNVVFTIPPGSTVPSTQALTVGGTLCFDSGGLAVTPCTGTNGAVNIIAGPSGPALSYNPAAGQTIPVAASISGTAVTSTIAVTQTGGDTGQTTTLTCTAPTGYTATVTGSPFAAGGTGGSIGLACSGGAAGGNLNCTETRSGTGGTTVNSTWPLTCNSAPGFSSTPADGGTLNIVGVQGSVTPGSVAVSNPGTAALNISNCAVTGAGFTLGTVSATVASGGTGSIGVSCAVPAVAGTTITGTLQCNTNAAAPADVINYNLSCLSQSASIPTLGFGGKALMVLLMLGFGLVGFQLYRRAA